MDRALQKVVTLRGMNLRYFKINVMKSQNWFLRAKLPY